MKTAMVEEKTDVIKMENGKKDLPIGISRTKYGSYRLQRTVGGKKYRFGSIRNLELALSVNAGIDELVNDLRKAQEEVVAVSADDLHTIIVENSLSDMEEITRLIKISSDGMDHHMNPLKQRLEMVGGEVARLHKRLDKEMHVITLEKKSFWQRITGR